MIEHLHRPALASPRRRTASSNFISLNAKYMRPVRKYCSGSSAWSLLARFDHRARARRSAAPSPAGPRRKPQASSSLRVGRRARPAVDGLEHGARDAARSSRRDPRLFLDSRSPDVALLPLHRREVAIAAVGNDRTMQPPLPFARGAAWRSRAPRRSSRRPEWPTWRPSSRARRSAMSQPSSVVTRNVSS